MSGEEATVVVRVRQLVRSRANAQPDNEQLRRSNRMRYFLTAFGMTHWAERVDRRRIALTRRGVAAL